MFQRVLIAEDHSATNTGLEEVVRSLNIDHIDTAKYCDDALLKIRAALQNNAPYDLLITDLSFKEDHRKRQLTSGEELINAVREIQPELKVIVFSIEHRVGKVKKLLENYNINGYVEKGREESKDIEKAILSVYDKKVYCSRGIQQKLHHSKNLLQIDEYDTLALQLMVKGLTQKQIAVYFQEHHIPASSIRSIENRFNRLKLFFDAKNSAQLIANAIERGFI